MLVCGQRDLGNHLGSCSQWLPRKEDLGSRNGGDGAGGDWSRWPVMRTPFQCKASLLCFFELWTTWASAGSSALSLPTSCLFLLPLQQQCRIKQDAPHHKWAQQDHPGIHMWIPRFTQTPAWWHGTFANIMSPDFHGNPGLPSHYLPRTDEKTASEKWNHLPEVIGGVRGRDGDLNSTWD